MQHSVVAPARGLWRLSVTLLGATLHKLAECASRFRTGRSSCSTRTTTRRRTARPTSTTRASRRGTAGASGRPTGGCSRTTRGSSWLRSAVRPGVQTARWAEGRHVERAARRARRRRRSHAPATSSSSSPLAGRGGAPRHRRARGPIADAPAGERGLRLRPGLRPDGETRTVAELGDAWKAEHSHRALARALALLVGASARARPARARHQFTSAPSTITFAITYSQTSSTAGPDSVCSTGLCFETVTYTGSTWNVASRITAAVIAPGSTSRNVRSTFVRT